MSASHAGEMDRSARDQGHDVQVEKDTQLASATATGQGSSSEKGAVAGKAYPSADTTGGGHESSDDEEEEQAYPSFSGDLPWSQRSWLYELKPFRGIYYDVKRRAPFVVSDWTSAFYPRNWWTVLQYVPRMYFINLMPAISYIIDMNHRTGGAYGLNEVILASALAAIVFPLFSIQPLTFVGVTGLINLVNYTQYDIVVEYYGLDRMDYLRVQAWSLIWAAVFHFIVSVFNICDFTRFITDMTSQTFGFYVGIVYIQKGIELLLLEFEPLPLDNSTGWLSVTIAILFTVSVYLVTAVGRTSFLPFKMRYFISSFAFAAGCIFWTGFSHFPKNSLNNVPIERLPITRSFFPSIERSWFIDFWNIEAKWAGVGAPLGFLIMLLFYFDHNVSSVMAQARQFPVKRPAGFHWDFFLLGITTLVSGFLGLPAPNGLVPQCPWSTEALSVYKQVEVPANDEEGTPLRRAQGTKKHHAKHHVVNSRVVENRVGHLIVGLLTLGTMTRPLLVVLGTMPRAIFAGIFLLVGWSSIEGNVITTRTLAVFKDRHMTGDDDLNTLRRTKIALFVGIQWVFFGLTIAISQTIAAIGFPVIITLLIPFRYYIVPRWFSPMELRILDAPTADADVVIASIGQETEAVTGQGKKVARDTGIAGTEWPEDDDDDDRDAEGYEGASTASTSHGTTDAPGYTIRHDDDDDDDGEDDRARDVRPTDKIACSADMGGGLHSVSTSEQAVVSPVTAASPASASAMTALAATVTKSSSSSSAASPTKNNKRNNSATQGWWSSEDSQPVERAPTPKKPSSLEPEPAIESTHADPPTHSLSVGSPDRDQHEGVTGLKRLFSKKKKNRNSESNVKKEEPQMHPTAKPRVSLAPSSEQTAAHKATADKGKGREPDSDPIAERDRLYAFDQHMNQHFGAAPVTVADNKTQPGDLVAKPVQDEAAPTVAVAAAAAAAPTHEKGAMLQSEEAEPKAASALDLKQAMQDPALEGKAIETETSPRKAHRRRDSVKVDAALAAHEELLAKRRKEAAAAAAETLAIAEANKRRLEEEKKRERELKDQEKKRREEESRKAKAGLEAAKKREKEEAKKRKEDAALLKKQEKEKAEKKKREEKEAAERKKREEKEAAEKKKTQERERKLKAEKDAAEERKRAEAERKRVALEAKNKDLSKEREAKEAALAAVIASTMAAKKEAEDAQKKRQEDETKAEESARSLADKRKVEEEALKTIVHRKAVAKEDQQALEKEKELLEKGNKTMESDMNLIQAGKLTLLSEFDAEEKARKVESAREKGIQQAAVAALQEDKAALKEDVSLIQAGKEKELADFAAKAKEAEEKQKKEEAEVARLREEKEALEKEREEKHKNEEAALAALVASQTAAAKELSDANEAKEKATKAEAEIRAAQEKAETEALQAKEKTEAEKAALATLSKDKAALEEDVKLIQAGKEKELAEFAAKEEALAKEQAEKHKKEEAALAALVASSALAAKELSEAKEAKEAEVREASKLKEIQEKAEEEALQAKKKLEEEQAALAALSKDKATLKEDLELIQAGKEKELADFAAKEESLQKERAEKHKKEEAALAALVASSAVAAKELSSAKEEKEKEEKEALRLREEHQKLEKESEAAKKKAEADVAEATKQKEEVERKAAESKKKEEAALALLVANQKSTEKEIKAKQEKQDAEAAERKKVEARELADIEKKKAALQKEIADLEAKARTAKLFLAPVKVPKGDLTPLSGQVAGHEAGIYSLSRDALVIKSCAPAESTFYQNVLIHETATSRKSQTELLSRLKKYLPTFHGTVDLTDGGEADPTSKLAVILENLTKNYKHANVLDVKLGKQLWDDEATEEKKKRMDEAARSSTSYETGLRLTGWQIWDSKNQEYVKVGKKFGKTIKASQIPLGLRHFFGLASVEDAEKIAELGEQKVAAVALSEKSMERILHDGVLPAIKEIYDTVKKLEWRVRGGSVLIVFEGDADEVARLTTSKSDVTAGRRAGDADQLVDTHNLKEVSVPQGQPRMVDVRLIDFAHATFGKEKGGDEGYLAGLDTLRHQLEDLNKALRKGVVKNADTAAKHHRDNVLKSSGGGVLLGSLAGLFHKDSKTEKPSSEESKVAPVTSNRTAVKAEETKRETVPEVRENKVAPTEESNEPVAVQEVEKKDDAAAVPVVLAGSKEHSTIVGSEGKAEKELQTEELPTVKEGLSSEKEEEPKTNEVPTTNEVPKTQEERPKTMDKVTAGKEDAGLPKGTVQLAAEEGKPKAKEAPNASKEAQPKKESKKEKRKSLFSSIFGGGSSKPEKDQEKHPAAKGHLVDNQVKPTEVKKEKEDGKGEAKAEDGTGGGVKALFQTGLADDAKKEKKSEEKSKGGSLDVSRPSQDHTPSIKSVKSNKSKGKGKGKGKARATEGEPAKSDKLDSFWQVKEAPSVPSSEQDSTQIADTTVTSTKSTGTRKLVRHENPRRGPGKAPPAVQFRAPLE